MFFELVLQFMYDIVDLRFRHTQPSDIATVI
jgi:hypothetical protein